MSISGSIPSHAYYGVPVTGNRPAGEQVGSRLAAASGPYVGRGNKCTANDDTCNGNRVKDEDFCAGHLRAVQKREKDLMSLGEEEVVEVTDGV